MAGLRRDMGRLVVDLAAQKAEAAASTATLAALDRVKTRMEAACSTLKVQTGRHAFSRSWRVCQGYSVGTPGRPWLLATANLGGTARE